MNMDSLMLAKAAAEILDAKKAENINVIRITSISSLGDYFVIANGTSNTHVHALADELEEKLGRKDADKKRRKADWQQTVAMTQASTLVQCHTKPGVRDGSMPGASVLMTMRMLDDEKK